MRNKGIIVDKTSMDLFVDIKRDSDGLIVGGLVVGDVTTQNQAVILVTQPGELKEDVTSGVGVTSMLDDSDLPKWRRRIKMQLESDGQKIASVAIKNKKILIDAKY